MADSKKLRFSKSPILKKNSRKFHRFVLGLVGLIDAKGIDVAQRIWSWGCLTWALKQAKNVFWLFLSLCRTASHDFLGNYANTDLIRQAKGESGQALVPIPNRETNKQIQECQSVAAS